MFSIVTLTGESFPNLSWAAMEVKARDLKLRAIYFDILWDGRLYIPVRTSEVH